MSRHNSKRLQGFLKKELKKLKHLSGLGLTLDVKWIPMPDERLYGEVSDNTIYIYDTDSKSALRTLIHEFIEYNIATIQAPLQVILQKTYADLLRSFGREVQYPLKLYVHAVNEAQYQLRENVVEGLTQLILKLRNKNTK